MTALPAKALRPAIDNICMARERVIDRMCTWDYDFMWLAEKMFTPEVLKGCEIGYQYGCFQHRIGNETFKISDEILIDSMDFKSHKMLTPTNKYSRGCDDLVAYCEEIKAVLVQFAKVEYVFNWLNDNCHNGASLAAHAQWAFNVVRDQWRNKLSGKHVVSPPGLGPMLPLIREAATTMATAFLTTPVDQKRKGFALTIDEFLFTKGEYTITVPRYYRAM